MRKLCVFVVVTCVVTAFGAAMTAGTAMAASPPPNDTISGASVVSSLPSSDTLDTTAATTDADDAQLNASNPQCTNPFGPTLNKSVWYKFTAGTEGALGVDAGASSYSVGIGIATGTPGALTTVACGLSTAFTATVPGTTYYVNAFDLFGDTGGTLQITFEVPPPAPTMTVSATAGTVDRTGTATITFRYACTNATTLTDEAQLTQLVGRFSISGFGTNQDIAMCDGTPHTSLLAIPGNGKFAGGKASLQYDFSVCGPFQCVDSTLTQTLQLRHNG
jgi:hypothetical protein